MVFFSEEIEVFGVFGALEGKGGELIPVFFRRN